MRKKKKKEEEEEEERGDESVHLPEEIDKGPEPITRPRLPCFESCSYHVGGFLIVVAA